MNATVKKALLSIAAAALLAACAKNEPPPEVVRPVRSVVLSSETSAQAVFAGEVRPRHETRLAFRVAGQILERRVELGTYVRAGDTIAVIDGRDLRLAETAGRAQLAQTETQASLAASELKRYGDLRAKNFISKAEFERREAQWRQAQDSADAARAEAKRLANQAGYAALIAPHAGVITAVEAEAGQVVAAGQTVVRLARPEEKEIALAVPENRLRELRAAEAIEVRLWARPEAVLQARLRELSPIADPASRTYPARLSLLKADSDIALGMSAEVRVRSSAPAAIVLPASAIFHKNGQPAVWVVEGDPAAVRLAAIELGAVSGEQVAVREGLKEGQVVVTAGVHALQSGEKVHLMQDVSLASARP